ncbi:MAG TPA: MSMEG_1061 family FMN-dependent PPOX-type flavoprotein [Conexibacter sp.]|jgi:PPOX class probable FMN-dependent enzyme|nr:MSMEG_1061 family FMN-dependent PPOX-type flavoprotein [Conexibacter sp.]
MAEDPFAEAITSEAQLRELYAQPLERAVRKQLDRLDELARRLIAVTPLVLVASHDADGRCDVTPRGGQPGFVTALDDDHLAIPDATGNNRLDTLQNVVATGHAALLFLIPGRDQTLRVNGAARITASPAVLGRITPVGKPPRTAIVVAADEVYAHCPKAFVRSRLWDPASWPAPADQPSPAEVAHAHLRDPALTVADVERQQEESIRTRLA